MTIIYCKKGASCSDINEEYCCIDCSNLKSCANPCILVGYNVLDKNDLLKVCESSYIATSEKDPIEDAIKLLKKNGYVVRKPTKTQLKDIEGCDGDKECHECSCSVCLFD